MNNIQMQYQKTFVKYPNKVSDTTKIGYDHSSQTNHKISINVTGHAKSSRTTQKNTSC